MSATANYLRRAIEADRLFSSIILWGPPGTGKTTLAQVIANTTKSHFVTISAMLAGKARSARDHRRGAWNAAGSQYPYDPVCG